MTKIVFACKSNSCRSQMAEGWAKEWIRQRTQELERHIYPCSSPEKYGFFDRKRTMSEDNAFISHIETTKKLRAVLDEVFVASVALDSASVFECTTGQCHKNDICETPAQRKAIKTKAVEAMAMDGVDITSFVPQTIEEVMLSLIEGKNFESHRESENATLRILPPNSSAAGKLSNASASTSTFLLTFNNSKPDPSQKPVDKLVVLCSCGDAIKRKLVRRSKSVEEWNIDAPTAAALSGEGDEAYRRVSLQIRKKVNILMESLLCSE